MLQKGQSEAEFYGDGDLPYKLRKVFDKYVCGFFFFFFFFCFFLLCGVVFSVVNKDYWSL